MKIKELKENQYYLINVYIDGAKWTEEEGEIGEPFILNCEEHLTKDINKVLNNYGYDLEDLETYKEHGLEKNRFTTSVIVNEEDKKFINYYDFYISILTESKDIEKKESE